MKVAALSRFGLLVIAALIVAAAIGLETLLGDGTRTQQGRGPWMLAGMGSAAVVTVVLAFLWLERPLLEDARQFAATTRSVHVAGVLLAGSLVGLWLAALSPSGARPFIVGAVIAADLLMFADGLHPLRPPRETFPAVPELNVVREDPGLFRVAGWQDALYPNSAVAYGLQDYRGFDAVGVRTYAGLLDVGFAFNGAFHALRHFATPHLLDLLNVKPSSPRPTSTRPAIGSRSSTTARPASTGTTASCLGPSSPTSGSASPGTTRDGPCAAGLST